MQTFTTPSGAPTSALLLRNFTAWARFEPVCSRVIGRMISQIANRAVGLAVCLVTALALNLAISLPAAAAKKVSGVPLDAAFKPAEQAMNMLSSSSAEQAVFKGIKRAAISSFQVEFVTKGAAKASSYEIGRSGTANTNVQMTLTGVGAADFQAITDQLYSDYLLDLKNLGLELVPLEQVLASAHYQKMAASGKPAPAETRTKDTWSTVYAPQGLGIYGVGSSSNAVALFAGFSAFSDVSNTMFANVELAKELDAALLVVRVVVNFVDMKSGDSSWFNRSSGVASVKSSVGASVAGDNQTTFTVHRANQGSAVLSLEAPLLLDTAAFSEVKDTSSVALNVGLAVLNLAIGKGGSSSAVEKEAVADPAQYRSVVGAGLGAVRSMFVSRLRAGQ